MPKRSNNFQKLVTFIEQEFSPDTITVSESAMIRDLVNGDEREIDILVQGEVGDYKISIGLECRDRKRKADLTWIDEIIGKYQHLPIDRKVAVSKSGFTKSALAKAAKFSIETLTFDEALDTDWIEEKARVVKWEIVGRSLNYKNVGFTFDTKHIPSDFGEKSILFGGDGMPIGEAQDLVNWIKTTPKFVEDSMQKEIEKVLSTIDVGIKSAEIKILTPSNLKFKSENGSEYNISRIEIELECRIEVIKPEIKEFQFKDKYLATVDAIFSDVPVEINVAVVSTGKEGDEFKWFFSSNQEVQEIEK